VTFVHVRLKYVADVRPSTVDKLSVEGQLPVRLCNYTDVYKNDIIVEGLPLAEATATPEQVERFKLRAGDVVTTKDSESPHDIAVPAYVPQYVDALCGYHLALLRPTEDVVPRYLHLYLQTSDAHDYFAVRALGVTRFGLRLETIKDLPVPIPPLTVQREVAQDLDRELHRVDAIEKQLRVVERLLLERRALSYLAEVAGHSSPGPRKDGDVTWAPSVPNHWRTVKLTRASRLGSGHTPSRANPDYWKNCTIPWITTGEVSQMRSDRIERIYDTRECISDVGVANSSAEVHPAGTVVLCRTAASAGYSAIMGVPMATSQDFATWTCTDELMPEYLLFCLRAMRDDLLERLAMGSTHQTIYMPDIEALRIPLPPLDEQRQIVDRVRSVTGSIDSALDALGQQLRLLRERRVVILDQGFRHVRAAA